MEIQVNQNYWQVHWHVACITSGMKIKYCIQGNICSRFFFGPHFINDLVNSKQYHF